VIKKGFEDVGESPVLTNSECGISSFEMTKLRGRPVVAFLLMPFPT